MPSPKHPQDDGFKGFGFRTKVHAFPSWKGVNKEGDTAQPPANQVREAVNVRPDLEGYVSRGGLTKAATNAATSDMDGLYEAGDIGAPVVADIPPPAGTIYILGVDPVAETAEIIAYDTATSTPTFSSFGTAGQYEMRGIIKTAAGDRYVTLIEDLFTGNWRATLMRLDIGPLALVSLFTQSSTSPLAFNDVREGDGVGVLYFGYDYTDTGPTGGHTFRWGSGTDDDDWTGVLPGTADFAALNVVGNGGIVLTAAQIGAIAGQGVPIRRRDSGVWSNLTMPTSAGGGTHGHCFFTGRPTVYSIDGDTYFSGGIKVFEIGTAEPYVIKVSGTTVTAEHAVGVLTNRSSDCVTEFNGFLYYVNPSYSTGIATALGRYSPGAGWVDSHDTSCIVLVNRILAMIPVTGSLYIIGEKSGTFKIIKSDGLDTTSWSLDYTFTGDETPIDLFAEHDGAGPSGNLIAAL